MKIFIDIYRCKSYNILAKNERRDLICLTAVEVAT